MTQATTQKSAQKETQKKTPKNVQADVHSDSSSPCTDSETAAPKRQESYQVTSGRGKARFRVQYKEGTLTNTGCRLCQ